MKKNRKNIEKIKALFLNKVKDLEWHYYNIDLSELADIKHFDYKDINYFDEFLAEIKYEGSSFVYKKSKNFPTQQVVASLLAYFDKYPNLFKELMLRIFDKNEKFILNNSDADEGTMGKLNRTDRKKRNNIYFEKIKDDFRNKSKDNLVILAEGDSWFEFPKIIIKDPVKDIVDHLIDVENYAIYSEAAGGDWLSNIMYMGEYIEDLSKISPDVFLVSGGGNDLVGDYRLASMVKNPKLEKLDDYIDSHNDLIERRNTNQHKTFKSTNYKNGLKYINEDFFLFMDLCFIQYFLLFKNLTLSKKYNNVLFITQGYDYPFPSDENRGCVISLQRILNKVIDTGIWLYQPLCMKGIPIGQDQKDIVYSMIYEFNEMLIQLASYQGFSNLFHVDCRGVAPKFDDWFDELHLISTVYKKIAKTYKLCIDNNKLKKGSNPNTINPKVYLVV